MTFNHGNGGHFNDALRSVDASVHHLETGMKGGFDYNSVYQEIGAMHRRDMQGGVLDAGLFRRQVDEMDFRFHKDGFLPHLHIRLDQGCTPLMVPDSGYGAIPRSHSAFGPFHTGHYLHRPHHQHLPPELVICGDGAGGAGTAGARQAVCSADQAGDYQVAADTVSGASPAIYGPASDGAATSPFQLASYREGGNLPDMSISDGGAPPGGLPDQPNAAGEQAALPAVSLPAPDRVPGGDAQIPTQLPAPITGGDAQIPTQLPAPITGGDIQTPTQSPAQIPVEILAQVPGDQPAPVVSAGDAPNTVPVAKVPDGQLTISGPPTITPEKIDEVLKAYHSPAAGMGQYVYDQGIKHGINPAMALAFYCVESQCGTKGLAVQNKSWGNVRGHGPHGYRPYDSIKDSLDKWYDMMVNLYRDKFHADKLSKVISHYAPNSDGNNEAAYVRSVGQMVRKWQC